MPAVELEVEDAVPAEIKLDQLAEMVQNMINAQSGSSSSSGKKGRKGKDPMRDMLSQVKEGARERRRMPIEIRNALDNSDDLLLAEDEGNSCVDPSSPSLVVVRLLGKDAR